MATIIGSPYSIGTPVGQGIADFGKAIWGDTLTPALKRAEMEQANAKTQGLNFTNQSNTDMQQMIANNKGSFSSLFQSPEFLSKSVGADNFKPQNQADLLRINEATNTANPITGGENPLSRAMMAAGQSMASTPMGFEQSDQTDRRGQDLTYSASRQNNADNNATSRANTMAHPYNILDENGIPMVSTYADAPGQRAIVKGVDPITGTLSVYGGKETETSKKADLMGAAMIPGVAGLMKAFDEGVSMTPSASAVDSLLPKNSFVTNSAQYVGAITPKDQELNANLDSALTYLYQMTGAARTPSEDARARANMPLPTDTPETRRIKQNVLAEIALGIAGQARDPRVKQQLVTAIRGSFIPVAGKDAPPLSPSALHTMVGKNTEGVDSGERLNDVNGMVNAVQQGGNAPVSGAKQAPDGNFYVPDPNRPGKYLRVDQ